MELNSQGDIPVIDPDKVTPFQRLALVKSSDVEFSPAAPGLGGTAFTPAEMRHNFAIWALRKHPPGGRAAHIYYCVRCKQALRVEDRSTSVTPLDQHGDVLHGSEAAKRLDAFSQGPCPAFSGLEGQRLTSRVSIQTARGRLVESNSAGRRTGKRIAARWRRFVASFGTQHLQSE